MNHTIFALKGTIAYTPAPQRFVFEEESFLVCRDGKVKGIWKSMTTRERLFSRACVICICMRLSMRFGGWG